MIIGTARLRLRPVEPADADDLVRLDSDPAVMRFVSGGVPTAREVVEDWVLPRAIAEARRGGAGMWVLQDRSTGSFLGWVALRAPRHSRRHERELSYRLRTIAWGRGLATEAAGALVEMTFQSTPTERLFASTTSANIASRKVMEKLGLRLSDVSDIDGDGSGDAWRVDCPEVEYELLRGQWEASLTRVLARRVSVGRHTA